MRVILSVIYIFLLLALSGRCSDVYSRRDFPEGFTFGSATSAYQWEGAVDEDGKKPSVWDTFLHSRNLANGDIACDGYHKLGVQGFYYYYLTLYAFEFVPYTSSSKDDEIAIQRAKDFFYGWILGPLTFGDYPVEMKRAVGPRLPIFSKEESELVKGSSDFIGIMHYFPASVKNIKIEPSLPRNPDFYSDMGVSLIYLGNFSGFGYDIVPWAMESVLEHIKQAYGNPPVYILENGTPMKPDLQLQQKDTRRIEYLRAYIGAVLKAVRNGSDTRGYFVWSFMDLYELLSGYELSFGLYSVNFSDPHRKRSPKLSAHWYSDFLKGKTTFFGSQGITQLHRTFSSSSL